MVLCLLANSKIQRCVCKLIHATTMPARLTTVVQIFSINAHVIDSFFWWEGGAILAEGFIRLHGCATLVALGPPSFIWTEPLIMRWFIGDLVRFGD